MKSFINNHNYLRLRQNPIDLTKYENEIGRQLPPKYGIFVSHYYQEFNIPLVKDTRTNKIYSMYSLNYPDPNNSSVEDILALEKFITIEQAIYVSDNGDWINEYDLLPISLHAFNATITVGLGISNYDQIFFSVGTHETKYLAPNIFSFFSNYKKEVNPIIRSKIEDGNCRYEEPYWIV